MDVDQQISEALDELNTKWKETHDAVCGHVEAIRKCGLDSGSSASLPRLNALAQDCLASLRSIQLEFDLLAKQHSTVEKKDTCLKTLEEWKREYQSIHAALRSANLQAKSNLQKAAKMQRDLLLGGGEESTNLRRNLQTQAGMTAAAESVTESLRRTRQMMAQELERGINTVGTLDESTTTLKKTNTEYKGQHALLITARGLLSVLKRQDIVDRIILVVGILFFSLVVSYIINQRIGLFKLKTTRPVINVVNQQHIPPSVSIDIHQQSIDIKQVEQGQTTDIKEIYKGDHIDLKQVEQEKYGLPNQELQKCDANAENTRHLEL